MVKLLNGEILAKVISEGEGEWIESLLYEERRFINAKANNYFLRSYTDEDIKQEIRIAFIKAARSFDFERGVKFRTYANKCIKSHFSALMNKTLKEPLNYFILDIQDDDFEVTIEEGLEDNALKELYLKKLKKELKFLTDDDREFILYAFSGYGGLKRICDRRGISYKKGIQLRNKILAILKDRIF